jgi:prophage regulatory protein
MPATANTAAGAAPAQFLRLPSVLERVPYSTASIWRLVRLGKFPRPIKMGGGRASAWLSSEIDAWMEQRVAARDLSP